MHFKDSFISKERAAFVWNNAFFVISDQFNESLLILLFQLFIITAPKLNEWLCMHM